MPGRGRPRTNPAPVQPQQAATPTEAIFYFLVPDDKDIDSICVNKVKEAVKNATLKELHLVVDSNGGDPYSAVKIIRILRSKFDKIIGFVPFKAMSAATLMLLGTHEIYMGEESQLGPLDLPMEHPTDGSPISCLDVFNTLSQLSSSAMSNAESMYESMRKGLPPYSEKIPKTQAIELALKYSTEIVNTIANKVDPYHRQKAVRRLKIAQWYAFDLLRTGMMDGRPSQSWETANNFVYGFPDHNYAIFKEEAMGAMLRLVIKDSKSYPGWIAMCQDVESKLKSASSSIITYIER